MAEITQEQLRDLIKAHIRTNFKTQSAFANSLGVSRAHVSRVLAGARSVPAEWLELVGATVSLTAKEPDAEGTYIFALSDAGFVGMPLGRVARYMKELAGMVGPLAVFVGMTANEIKFREVNRG